MFGSRKNSYLKIPVLLGENIIMISTLIPILMDVCFFNIHLTLLVAFYSSNNISFFSSKSGSLFSINLTLL
jgi:hypothetical protein